MTKSGKDAEGKAHTVVVDVNLDLSNINSTTPDKIDLKGSGKFKMLAAVLNVDIINLNNLVK